MPKSLRKPDFYDPERAEAAAELWSKLHSFEGEDADAQLIIEKAMSEYACTADKRIEDSEWAQKYRGACEKIGEMLEALHRVRNWGITSKGYDGGHALALAAWVDGECCKPLPPLEEHLKTRGEK